MYNQKLPRACAQSPKVNNSFALLTNVLSGLVFQLRECTNHLINSRLYCMIDCFDILTGFAILDKKTSDKLLSINREIMLLLDGIIARPECNMHNSLRGKQKSALRRMKILWFRHWSLPDASVVNIVVRWRKVQDERSVIVDRQTSWKTLLFKPICTSVLQML